jgi:hypothetical protein
LFRRGASPADAAGFFAEEQQTTLGAEYWAWVKNQAIEKKIDFDDRLTDPCRIVVPRDDLVTGPVAVLAYPAADSPREVKGTLPRLSATVVRIIFPQDVDRTTITVSGPEELAYKVYLNGEDDGQDGCAAVADRERTFESLSIVDVVYVLLANTRHEHDSRIEYTVQAMPAATPVP